MYFDDAILKFGIFWSAFASISVSGMPMLVRKRRGAYEKWLLASRRVESRFACFFYKKL